MGSGQVQSGLHSFKYIRLINFKAKDAPQKPWWIFLLNFANLKIIKDADKLFSQISFKKYSECRLRSLRKEVGSLITWEYLSSPDEMNLIIRQTPSAAGETAGTRRFCFLGYRE